MKVGATQDGLQGIKRHHDGRRMPLLVYGLVYKGLGAPAGNPHPLRLSCK